jgi:hypothetical protein
MIAALSGTSRSTVQRALRKAKDVGLLLVRERRRAGQKSLSNLVSIISHQLRSWLRLKDKGTLSPQRPTSSWLQTGMRGASKLVPCLSPGVS